MKRHYYISMCVILLGSVLTVSAAEEPSLQNLTPLNFLNVIYEEIECMPYKLAQFNEVLNELDTYLKEGGDPRQYRNYPLHTAAEEGHTAFLQNLLYCPEDVDTLDIVDNTPLHKAVEGNQLDAVKILYAARADVTKRDLHGATALHKAASYGYMPIADFLVANRPHAINERDEQGDTPLHKAAEGGYLALVDLLLQNNPVVIKNNVNKTPLGVALDSYPATPTPPRREIIKQLIRFGVEPSAVERELLSRLFPGWEQWQKSREHYPEKEELERPRKRLRIAE